jgi:PTS system cellobiose-specific IIC component
MSRSSGESRRSSADSSESAPGTSLLPAGDGFVARLERAVAPFARRVSDAPAVRALQESLPAAFGVLLVVLVLLVFLQPFAGWGAIPQRLRDAVSPGFAIASIAMVLVLATRLAIRLAYPIAVTVATALVAFCFALPRAALADLVRFVATAGAHGWGAFAKTLGASGLFTAIVVSLASAGAIALGRRRFGIHAGTIAGACGLIALSAALFSVRLSLAGALSAMLAPLATLGDSFVALLAITAIESLLFVVGIHGPALLAAIVLPIYVDLQVQNTAAAHAHQPLPHLVVVSTFLFVFPGGAGATLPLVLLLLRSRVPRLKKIAYATLVPSLLNVNEPVIFGLPLAYNPALAVPFILAPVALACTTYAALGLGWVGRPIYYVPSTLPPLVNVFLATFDLRACVLQAANIGLAAVIWLPFVRIYERAQASRT